MDAEKFVYEVRKIDGVYQVETEPGHLISIRNDSDARVGPPGTYASGWEPRFVDAGLAPVYLLEWEHEKGGRGTWYLDSDMKRVGGSDKEPPPQICNVIRQKAGSLLANLWDGLLCAPVPTLDRRANDFQRLNHQTRLFIIGLCGPILPLEPSITNIGQAFLDDRTVQVFNGTRLVEICPTFLRRLLDEDCFVIEKAIKGLPEGALTWASPVDGRPLQTDAVVCFSHFRFAFRLVDNDHQLVFYVIAADHNCRVVALLFPASNQIFCSDGESIFRRDIPHLGKQLLEHICEFGSELEGYLRAPQRSFAYYVGIQHHGHLLFNELAGIDELVHRLSAKDLPDIVMRVPQEPQGDVEVFGRVEDLFPVFRGKVHRTTNWSEIVRHAYTARRSLLRATLE